MVESLMVSNVLLWCLNIALLFVVFALARQIGVLSERVAPAGALTPKNGPKIGEALDPIGVETLAGERMEIGGVRDKLLLTLFVSPTCPICRSLVPAAKSLARREGMQLVFASDGDTPEKHQRYAQDLELSPYVLSQPLGLAMGVSQLPFAALIDTQGVLVAKGLVNTSRTPRELS